MGRNVRQRCPRITLKIVTVYPIGASVVSVFRGVTSLCIAGFSPLNLAPFTLASTILIW
jgi:hypothetical protein